ncbi:MAG TPA: hypothetical protein H9694_05195 [Firmicutes bacterium]|nr:hypothetical protein [Bacillota bacterium]
MPTAFLLFAASLGLYYGEPAGKIRRRASPIKKARRAASGVGERWRRKHGLLPKAMLRYFQRLLIASANAAKEKMRYGQA